MAETLSTSVIRLETRMAEFGRFEQSFVGGADQTEERFQQTDERIRKAGDRHWS